MADLMNSLNDYCKSAGIYSDLELISAKKLYAAHRVIACLRSSFISKFCHFKDACATRDNLRIAGSMNPSPSTFWTMTRIQLTVLFNIATGWIIKGPTERLA
jgi:hypothetical protein